MVVNWNAFVSNGLAHSFISHVNIMNVLSLYGNSVSLGNQLLKINKCHASRISPTVWSEYNVESHAQQPIDRDSQAPAPQIGIARAIFHRQIDFHFETLWFTVNFPNTNMASMALKPVWEHLAHGNTTALGKNQIISGAQMPMPLRRNGCVNYATRKYFFFDR